MKILETLTEEQTLAVTADPGIIQLTAGPGTGKTRCVTARAVWISLTDRHSRVLVLSHTRKAVSEVRVRIARALPDLFRQRIKIMTLHGFSLRCARMMGLFDGMRLVSEEEKLELLERCIQRHPVFDDVEYIGHVIENCKNLLISPEEAYCLVAEDIAKIYEIYEAEKKKEKAFDFEDMLVSVYRSLSSNHRLAAGFRGYFDHIIVDEAHDMNKAQYEILRIIQDGSLYLVLDPNQRIFRFRAGGGPLLRIRQDYPDSKEFRLTVNFRSGRRIVEATNRLMNADIRPRPDAPEGDLEVAVEDSWQGQINTIAEKIAQVKEGESVAILVRTNYQVQAMAGSLKELGFKINAMPGKNHRVPKIPSRRESLWDRIVSFFSFKKTTMSPPRVVRNTAARNTKVTILTIHKAKGKEWDCVIVPDAVKDLPCCKEEREDEKKRIFYVATTRPRKTLIITAARECYGEETEPSPYISCFSST